MTHRFILRASRWWYTEGPSCFWVLRETGVWGRRVRGAAHLEHGLCGERMQEGVAKKVGEGGCGGAELGPRWRGAAR